MKKVKSALTGVLFILVSSCNVEMVDKPIGPQPEIPLAFSQFGIRIGDSVYSPIDTLENSFFICVPQNADISKLKAVFTVPLGLDVYSDSVLQESDVSENNFTDINKGIKYSIRNKDGEKKEYVIKILNTNLPTVFIHTPELRPIEDKVNWISGSSIKIWTHEKGINYSDTTNIRGRGNYTWTYPKKPYAIKLNKKASLLGLSKHKRYCLLALWKGYIGNLYMAEVAKRCVGKPWVPQGEFVELVLNGSFLGLYYLSEQIKIDKNRVNITEIKKDDLSGINLTGGYLLEYDQEFDEEYKFDSDIYKMPVMLKSPDDDVPQEQFDYIKNYVNKMEEELSKIGNEESHYQDYLDINSFADFWMASEVIYNHEVYKPRSFYMYKGRDGVDSPEGTACKMKAGPFWDQEMIFTNHWWNNKDAHYFGALFKDSDYRKTVKNNWRVFRNNLEGKGDFPHVIDVINLTYDKIAFSANRDSSIWNNSSFSITKDVKTLNDGFTSKLDWMEEFINSLE